MFQIHTPALVRWFQSYTKIYFIIVTNVTR
jgi:hypothetical protein